MLRLPVSVSWLLIKIVQIFQLFLLAACLASAFSYFFWLLPNFFIPEKDGEHWEPSIYKGRDGRRDKRCFLSYCLTCTCQRGGPTGKVNLITDSLNPHTQITASVKTLQQNTFMLINYCRSLQNYHLNEQQVTSRWQESTVSMVLSLLFYPLCSLYN